MEKADKHPELVKKIISELNDEEKRELKHLDSEAWDEKNIDISMRDVDVDVNLVMGKIRIFSSTEIFYARYEIRTNDRIHLKIFSVLVWVKKSLFCPRPL